MFIASLIYPFSHRSSRPLDMCGHNRWSNISGFPHSPCLNCSSPHKYRSGRGEHRDKTLKKDDPHYQTHLGLTKLVAILETIFKCIFFTDLNFGIFLNWLLVINVCLHWYLSRHCGLLTSYVVSLMYPYWTQIATALQTGAYFSIKISDFFFTDSLLSAILLVLFCGDSVSMMVWH